MLLIFFIYTDNSSS